MEGHKCEFNSREPYTFKLFGGIGLSAGLRCRYASVFQMLRGTMVVFTGLLTVLLLKRRLHIHHWLGIALISAGAAIVGTSRQSPPTPHNVFQPTLPKVSLCQTTAVHPSLVGIALISA
jgi:drug/metabolite transporter (DMT)-like permease